MLVKIPPHLKCVATLPCELPGAKLKAAIENKKTSEVKRPILSHEILYKQTKLLKNTDQMPMTSVMTSVGTVTTRRISIGLRKILKIC